MSKILAIDPGTHESGWCFYCDGLVVASGISSNELVVASLSAGQSPDALSGDKPEEQPNVLAIEMIASYGMAVGKEVFETCVWIGRFQQAWHTPRAVLRVYRGQVKQHLCGTAKAKDANIRQALLDKLGPQGVKAKPGPTYGVKSHAWAALAVAVTAAETMLAAEPHGAAA